MALLELFDRPINNNPADTKRLAFAGSDSPIENIELEEFYILLAEKLGLNNFSLTKVIEIGDWNMDADDRVFISLPIASHKIRRISALIRADDDTDANPRRYSIYSYDSSMGGECIIYDNTVAISRPNASFFNSSLFDSTSFNRGWLTIDYIL